jgi:D-3-phosphoglycerate dehydrogenase
MYKIKTLNNISPVGIKLLDSEQFVYGEKIDEPNGILVRSANMHDMPVEASLQAIARAGAGVNNIPIPACSEKGVVVFNTPGANANAVCEMVICALLLASRDITGGVDWTRKLTGSELTVAIEKGKSRFSGPEILSKKLGVVGLGAVGLLVANAACALGMDVYGYDPYISVNSAWKLSRSVHKAESLDLIYSVSDYITLHTPLLDSTKAMINGKSISVMKDAVRIVNFARGELVDDDAIIAAIKSGKVARYVTDFPTVELINTEGVVPVPHLGASTPESEENCAVMAVEELKDYLLNGNIKNSVNFPDISLERAGAFRLTLCHRNIQGELNNILSLLSDEKVNVENMINRSKGDYAYTIINLNTHISAALLDKVGKINGVLKLRTFVQN